MLEGRKRRGSTLMWGDGGVYRLGTGGVGGWGAGWGALVSHDG